MRCITAVIEQCSLSYRRFKTVPAELCLAWRRENRLRTGYNLFTGWRWMRGLSLSYSFSPTNQSMGSLQYISVNYYIWMATVAGADHRFTSHSEIIPVRQGPFSLLYQNCGITFPMTLKSARRYCPSSQILKLFCLRKAIISIELLLDIGLIFLLYNKTLYYLIILTVYHVVRY